MMQKILVTTLFLTTNLLLTTSFTTATVRPTHTPTPTKRLTNAHVVRKSTQLQVQAPDERKYPARLVDGGFSPKYDLALLTIESTSKYQLPDLSDRSTIDVNSRDIYSAGYPFDSNDLRITSAQVSQLSDIPFDDSNLFGISS